MSELFTVPPIYTPVLHKVSGYRFHRGVFIDVSEEGDSFRCFWDDDRFRLLTKAQFKRAQEDAKLIGWKGWKLSIIRRRIAAVQEEEVRDSEEDEVMIKSPLTRRFPRRRRTRRRATREARIMIAPTTNPIHLEKSRGATLLRVCSWQPP